MDCRASLGTLNAVCSAVDQSQVTPLRVKAIKGAAILAIIVRDGLVIVPRHSQEPPYLSD